MSLVFLSHLRGKEGHSPPRHPPSHGPVGTLHARHKARPPSHGDGDGEGPGRSRDGRRCEGPRGVTEADAPAGLGAWEGDRRGRGTGGGARPREPLRPGGAARVGGASTVAGRTLWTGRGQLVQGSGGPAGSSGTGVTRQVKVRVRWRGARSLGLAETHREAGAWGSLMVERGKVPGEPRWGPGFREARARSWRLPLAAPESDAGTKQ